MHPAEQILAGLALATQSAILIPSLYKALSDPSVLGSLAPEHRRGLLLGGVLQLIGWYASFRWFSLILWSS